MFKLKKKKKKVATLFFLKTIFFFNTNLNLTSFLPHWQTQNIWICKYCKFHRKGGILCSFPDSCFSFLDSTWVPLHDLQFKEILVYLMIGLCETTVWNKPLLTQLDHPPFKPAFFWLAAPPKHSFPLLSLKPTVSLELVLVHMLSFLFKVLTIKRCVGSDFRAERNTKMNPFNDAKWWRKSKWSNNKQNSLWCFVGGFKQASGISE